jgi:hypothetical protein
MLVSASQDRRVMERVGNQLVFKFDYINLVGTVKDFRNVKYRILLIKNVQLLAMLLAIYHSNTMIFISDTNPAIVTNTFTEFVSALNN